MGVVRAGVVKLFLGTSLPPSQHCRIPVLDVRWALVALLGPWGDRAWSCSPDTSSSPSHSLSFPEAWLFEHRRGWVWKLFPGKSRVHGVRGYIMVVLCSLPCVWDCPGSHRVTHLTQRVSITPSVCRWSVGSDPWGIPSLGCPCSLSLCLQIPAEESEDELLAGEERPDTRLSEGDTAGGNQEGNKDGSKEGAVTEETDGDGHREGQEAEQPDRTVTAPRDPAEGCTLKPGNSDLGEDEQFGAEARVCV